MPTLADILLGRLPQRAVAVPGNPSEDGGAVDRGDNWIANSEFGRIYDDNLDTVERMPTSPLFPPVNEFRSIKPELDQFLLQQMAKPPTRTRKAY